MIRLAKYHGLGNDFVLVQANDVTDWDPSQLARKWCDRHTGIGADGLILVATDPLTMLYYNADGSQAKMCGNGIRCFASYVYREGIVSSTSFEVVTLAGPYAIELVDGDVNQIRVNMGKPDFKPAQIPIAQSHEMIQQSIVIQDQQVTLTSLFMGTTHTVLFVDDLDNVDLVELGTAIQQLAMFPEGTNVNFVETTNNDIMRLRTYERGAGLTLACGTGATAAYAAIERIHGVDHPISFRLPLGDLVVWRDSHGDLIMEGPATFVFETTQKDVMP